MDDLGSSVLCYISHSLNQIPSKNRSFAHLDFESKCVTAFYLTFIQIKEKAYKIKLGAVLQYDGTWSGCIHLLCNKKKTIIYSK